MGKFLIAWITLNIIAMCYGVYVFNANSSFHYNQAQQHYGFLWMFWAFISMLLCGVFFAGYLAGSDDNPSE